MEIKPRLVNIYTRAVNKPTAAAAIDSNRMNVNVQSWIMLKLNSRGAGVRRSGVLDFYTR